MLGEQRPFLCMCVCLSVGVHVYVLPVLFCWFVRNLERVKGRLMRKAERLLLAR
jgi:hypothetical protein